MENFDNPADFKTVHLSMEVVALKNARPEVPSMPFFNVLVQGDRYNIQINVAPSSLFLVHLSESLLASLIIDESTRLRTLPWVSVMNFRSISLKS